MDRKLLAWARAVKARRRRRGPPPLFLFTDFARTPDVLAAVAALPCGLCGVVFRHDGVPGRAALLRRLARVCRDRRLMLVVAGAADAGWGLRRGAGRHLRRGVGRRAHQGLLTSSAHGRAELVRAQRAGAALVFLSPAFATASHPGASGLGPVRWAGLARRSRVPVYALGGVSGRTVRLLPRFTAGAGAIGALVP